MMLLTTQERLALDVILPKKGNYDYLKILKVLLAKIAFRPDEIEELALKRPGERYKENGVEKVVQMGSVHFNEIPTKEFDLTPEETTIIINTLREMDRRRTLDIQYMSLCEKFLIPTQQEGAST